MKREKAFEDVWVESAWTETEGVAALDALEKV